MEGEESCERFDSETGPRLTVGVKCEEPSVLLPERSWPHLKNTTEEIRQQRVSSTSKLFSGQSVPESGTF